MLQHPRFKIILASRSPRRQELIRGLELPYEVFSFDTDESFPPELKAGEIALFLAEKKAKAFPETLHENELLLTADTIVWVNGHVLNKPADEKESFNMIREICGTTHEVFTGVCFEFVKEGKLQLHSFVERSTVTCRLLTDEEIMHYINSYKPFDKAGSYGIQDWFGYTAVESIEGCFYNVMGLPISRVYKELKLIS